VTVVVAMVARHLTANRRRRGLPRPGRIIDLAGNPRLVAAVVFGTRSSDIGALEFQPHARSFTWRFDDGRTAAGAAVSHAFAHPGRHSAAVTVTDHALLSASVTSVITVVGAPGDHPRGGVRRTSHLPGRRRGVDHDHDPAVRQRRSAASPLREGNAPGSGSRARHVLHDHRPADPRRHRREEHGGVAPPRPCARARVLPDEDHGAQRGRVRKGRAGPLPRARLIRA
jgi:hypothetical protein